VESPPLQTPARDGVLRLWRSKLSGHLSLGGGLIRELQVRAAWRRLRVSKLAGLRDWVFGGFPELEGRLRDVDLLSKTGGRVVAGVETAACLRVFDDKKQKRVPFDVAQGRLKVASKKQNTLRAGCRLLVVLKRAAGSDFAPSLRDCGSYVDTYPGVRCTSPGLISILPPGERS